MYKVGDKIGTWTVLFSIHDSEGSKPVEPAPVPQSEPEPAPPPPVPAVVQNPQKTAPKTPRKPVVKEELKRRAQSLNAARAAYKYSKFKGVSFYKRTGKWYAYVYSDKRQVSLGLHDEEIDAARAVNAKLIELYGEAAILNAV